MFVKYIKLKNSKKTKILIVALAFLILSYLLLQFFETNEVVARKVEFSNSTKSLEFYLGGDICGIKLLATGVLVCEVDSLNTNLKVGDIITRIDNNPIDSNQELIEYINSKDVKGNEVTLTVENNKKERKVKIVPKINNETGMYELGLWVKDSSAGVGTISFYEKKTNTFAALGHGITETYEGILLPIDSGAIVKAKIVNINKGTKEKPGDIRGTIYKDVYGDILKNTQNGIYGKVENNELYKNKQKILVAPKNEIKTGKAYIYCTLDNEGIKKYEIEIKNVLYDSVSNKNMIIKITDEKLLEKTGGIIQGMSGSPIVQNDKLIGAVTHVFLNDPKEGYAVFAEKMIQDIKMD